MARGKKRSAGRLTPEQAAHKAHLEMIVKGFNERGQFGTVYHERLEQLRRIEAAFIEEAEDEAADIVEEKDNDRSSL